MTAQPEFQGCREGEDHELECYYEDSGKWVHVKRLPLSQVIQLVREKLGTRPTVVVDSGAGYHLYFKLTYEVEASKLAKLEAKLVNPLGGDPQSKDLARIVRLPGSINPKVNRPVRVIYYEPSELIDRLGRAMLDVLNTIAELEKRRVKVIMVREELS